MYDDKVKMIELFRINYGICEYIKSIISTENNDEIRMLLIEIQNTNLNNCKKIVCILKEGDVNGK